MTLIARLFPKTIYTFESNKSSLRLLEDLKLHCEQRKNYRCVTPSHPAWKDHGRFYLENRLVYPNMRTPVEAQITDRQGGCTLTVTVKASVIHLILFYVLFSLSSVICVMMVIGAGFNVFGIVIPVFFLIWIGLFHYIYRGELKGIPRLFKSVV